MTRETCQYCGHPVLRPIVSDYRTNCGKLTGALSGYDPYCAPKKDELLFEVTRFLGKTSYKFFPEEFQIWNRSKLEETLPYSLLEDCEALFRNVFDDPNSGIELRVKIILKGKAPRELEL